MISDPGEFCKRGKKGEQEEGDVGTAAVDSVPVENVCVRVCVWDGEMKHQIDCYDPCLSLFCCSLLPLCSPLAGSLPLGVVGAAPP